MHKVVKKATEFISVKNAIYGFVLVASVVATFFVTGYSQQGDTAQKIAAVDEKIDTIQVDLEVHKAAQGEREKSVDDKLEVIQTDGKDTKDKVGTISTTLTRHEIILENILAEIKKGNGDPP